MKRRILSCITVMTFLLCMFSTMALGLEESPNTDDIIRHQLEVGDELVLAEYDDGSQFIVVMENPEDAESFTINPFSALTGERKIYNFYHRYPLASSDTLVNKVEAECSYYPGAAASISALYGWLTVYDSNFTVTWRSPGPAGSQYMQILAFNSKGPNVSQYVEISASIIPGSNILSWYVAML